MRGKIVLLGVTAALLGLSTAASGGDACIDCHTKISPGQVQDWQVSKHSANDVTCSTCHGDKHMTADDYTLAMLPDEKVCAECHEDQFNQFSTGKHNYGWSVAERYPGNPSCPG